MYARLTLFPRLSGHLVCTGFTMTDTNCHWSAVSLYICTATCFWHGLLLLLLVVLFLVGVLDWCIEYHRLIKTSKYDYQYVKYTVACRLEKVPNSMPMASNAHCMPAYWDMSFYLCPFPGDLIRRQKFVGVDNHVCYRKQKCIAVDINHVC